MADFKFTCPHCEQHLEASEEILGATIQCPSCKKDLTLAKPVSPDGSMLIDHIAPPPPLAQAKQSSRFTFRETTSLTKLLKILFGANAAMAIVCLFSNWLQFELLSRGTFSLIEGHANDSRQQIVALFTEILSLVTAVLFLRWVYRANQNVRALGAQGLGITPGWAVGYFFVPIFSLWRPYQAMRDLWKASKNPNAWQSVVPGSILQLWWLFWIISSSLGWAAFRASMGARNIESLKAATTNQIVSNVVEIPLCILALILVSQIQLSQNAARASNTPL